MTAISESSMLLIIFIIMGFRNIRFAKSTYQVAIISVIQSRTITEMKAVYILVDISYGLLSSY